MTTQLITQITDTLVTSIDIKLVIILLAIGYCLKNRTDKVSNGNIPIILGIIGIVLAVVFHFALSKEAILDAIIIGIASAVASVGIYEAKKSVTGIYKEKAGISDGTQDN